MSLEELNLSLQDIIVIQTKIELAHPIGHVAGQDTLATQDNNGGKQAIQSKKPK